MAKKFLFRTKDNMVVVMDMPYTYPMLRAKKAEYKSIISNHDYNKFINDMNDGSLGSDYRSNFDDKNTPFVNENVHGFSYQKQPAGSFVNNSGAPYPTGMAPILPDMNYKIEDDDVPQDVKSLGFKIEPYDAEWQVSYNPATDKYEKHDSSGEFKAIHASINPDERRIKIWRHHFKMDSATQGEMDRLIDAYKSSGKNIDDFAADLSDKEKSLFSIYKNELGWNKSLKLSLHHEFKHIKNTMFCDTVYLNRAQKRMSAADTIRLVEHDECVSRISEIVNEVNEYLKRGEWDNFDCFIGKESAWLVAELKTKPADERKEFLKNPANYVTQASKDWKNNDQKWYEENQFDSHGAYQGRVLDFIDKTPMHLPEDTPDMSETYKKMRKLLYHFALYNPDTGKYEQKYLDKYLDPSLEELSADAKRKILPKAQARLHTRKAEYDRAVRDGADVGLLEIARKLMRQRKASLEYTEPNNLYIESLDADYIATHGISSDADWSNNLQAYYKRQSSYMELAKNDEEYAFSLNNDTVRYTNKNTLGVSKNSKFATFMKILAEPSNKGNTVNFMPSLDKNQALMLYAACVASGCRMRGNVPTNLSGLDRLEGIDDATRALINRRLRRTPTTPTPAPTSTPTPTAHRSYYYSHGGYGRR